MIADPTYLSLSGDVCGYVGWTDGVEEQFCAKLPHRDGYHGNWKRRVRERVDDGPSTPAKPIDDEMAWGVP